MVKKKHAPTTIELKRLLVELMEHSPETGVRFRLLGKMWAPSFARILLITIDDVVITQDYATNKVSYTPIHSIVQFEIETAFQQFEPLNHYEVDFKETAV